jgi:hypothetical protein
MSFNLTEYEQLMNRVERISNQRNRLAKLIPRTRTTEFEYLANTGDIQISVRDMNRHIDDLANIELELRKYIQKNTKGLPEHHGEGSTKTSPRATLKRS